MTNNILICIILLLPLGIMCSPTSKKCGENKVCVLPTKCGSVNLKDGSGAIIEKMFGTCPIKEVCCEEINVIEPECGDNQVCVSPDQCKDSAENSIISPIFNYRKGTGCTNGKVCCSKKNVIVSECSDDQVCISSDQCNDSAENLLVSILFNYRSGIACSNEKVCCSKSNVRKSIKDTSNLRSCDPNSTKFCVSPIACKDGRILKDGTGGIVPRMQICHISEVCCAQESIDINVTKKETAIKSEVFPTWITADTIISNSRICGQSKVCVSSRVCSNKSAKTDLCVGGDFCCDTADIYVPNTSTADSPKNVDTTTNNSTADDCSKELIATINVYRSNCTNNCEKRKKIFVIYRLKKNDV